MKSNTKPGLCCAGCLLGLVVALHAAPARADEWAVLRQNAAKVKSIKAAFVQQKNLKILARPLISRGTFYFQAPSSIRWEYTAPIKTVTLVHKGKAKRFSWSRVQKKYQQDASAKLEAMRIVIEKITGWLSGRFQSDSGFKATLQKGPPHKVILTPQSADQQKFIQRVEILFSQRPGVLQSVTIIESEHASTLIQFKNAELNPKLPDAIFVKCP